MARERRILSRFAGVAKAQGERFGRALALCVLFVLCAWALDMAAEWASAWTPSRSRTAGFLAAFGYGLFLALPMAVAIALFAALSPSGPGLRARRVQVTGWLFEQDPAAQRDRAAALLAALLICGLWLAGSYASTKALVVGMADPRFGAAAIVAAQLTLAGCAAVLWPALRGLAGLAVAGLLRVPGARVLVRSAGVLLIVAAVVAAGAAAFAVFRLWPALAMLPWRPMLVWSGAALLTAVLALLFGRAPRFLRWVGQFALLASAGVGLFALFSLGQLGDEARRSASSTSVGSAGYAAALFALDFDRDGALHLFGGGDCRPFKRRIGPGMIDVPNNGRDEDCDGVDLNDKQLWAAVRRDFPVPAIAKDDRPSVVLITIDAFAARRLAHLGYKRKVTPNIDAFADGAALFRYTFSQGPSTRLSFPSIFTSRYDTQIETQLIGKHPYPIGESEVLLAEVLAVEGYDSAAVIPAKYFTIERWGTLTSGFRQVIDSPIAAANPHNSRAVTDAALAALKQPRKGPLFLWAHYYDAHAPHVQPAGMPVFGESLGDVYDAELALCDREVGRLLGALAQLPKPPVIVITGDHGIAFDEPRHAKFNYAYDLSTAVLHVPLIVKGPGIVKGVHDGIVSTMDIAPTLINLLGIQSELPFEGASLVPELLEGKTQRPELLLHEFYVLERIWKEQDPLELISLRNDRYNLIQDRKHGLYEFYDWRADYYEQHDLSESPEHRAQFAALKQQLSLMTFHVHAWNRAKSARIVLGPPQN